MSSEPEPAIKIYPEGVNPCAGYFPVTNPRGEKISLLCTRRKGHKGPHQWVKGERELYRERGGVPGIWGKNHGWVQGDFTEKETSKHDTEKE